MASHERINKAETETAVAPRDASGGMVIEHVFSSPGQHAFDQITWENRCARISDEKGKLVFEQADVEVPADWSLLATNVVVSKYFYGEHGKSEREHSVRQLVHRVTRTIADWGKADGIFASDADAETFYNELTYLCANQYASFNSPVWFNVGLFHQSGVQGSEGNYHWDGEQNQPVKTKRSYEYPQGSACFIQSVDDTMEDIMRLCKAEAMLFKFGSGTGTDLSTLRSSREKLSGGGKPSGPLSFMRIFDQIAAVVRSGGKTRRAAKMQSLKVSHPDIKEFIECKMNEEKKAWALIEQGYDGSLNGDAYASVMYQNANLSVRLTDEFMQAALANKDWQTYAVTDPTKPMAKYRAKELLELIAEGTRICGDPGVQYHTTVNRWHTCPQSGEINASNPCVTGETLVATAQGYRRIRDLVGKSLHVIDGDGKPAWVDRVFPTGHKPVYELKTRAGYRLRLTADHRVLTLNRGDVPAAELTVDDVLPLGQSGFGDEFLSPALGELIGAAVGDGCISRQPDQDFLTVSLSGEEAGVANRLQANIVESKRFLELDDGRAFRSTRVVRTSSGLRVGSSVARLLECMQCYAVLDRGSENKLFTDEIFSLDRATQAAVLRGLFTTDGTVANYGEKSQYVSLDSTSLELLQQVQLMLLGFGIKGKLYENRRALGQDHALLPDGKGGSRLYPVRQMHSLRISRHSRVLFEREIGFLAESHKARKLSELNRDVTAYREELVDRVASLTPCGSQDVFDLTEPLTHHFVAGGLVVHNCSEYMFINDSACNLASLNLLKFRRADGSFDIQRFRSAVRVFVIAQEILVDHGSYPNERICRNSHEFRPLGLGYANLGSLIMSLGLPYDSDGGRATAAALTAIMTGAAYATSAELSSRLGPFAGYHRNRQSMLGVIRQHREHVDRISADQCPQELVAAAAAAWDQAIAAGEQNGYRNAQVTVLAPTGTIGFMMDCDTTGIEPDIALVKYKQLAGGGMFKIVNRTVPLALERLKYNKQQVGEIIDHIDQNDTIEGAPHLAEGHLAVFDCAFKPAKGNRSIHYMGHIRMMSAVQPFLSGAISKTVNMPKESTMQDILQVYVEGWKLGLKAVAIYRDGSKRAQPLNVRKSGDKEKKPEAAPAEAKFAPHRHRLPATRPSITHKFDVAGHEGYLNVGLYDDGKPGELFITMAKEGSTVGGMMDAFATAISLCLQYGVPLEALVKKFSHQRFEPNGMTSNKDIPFAKSIVDYVFRWLGLAFIEEYRKANLPQRADHSPKVSDMFHKLSSPKAAPEAVTEDVPSESSRTPKASDTEAQRPLGFYSNDAGSTGAAPPAAGGNGHVAPAAPKAARAAMGEALESRLASRLDRLDQQFSHFQEDAPACDVCGSITVRNGNCYKCYVCGSSLGCS